VNDPSGVCLTPFSLTEYECWNQASADKEEIVSIWRIIFRKDAIIILVEALASFSHFRCANLAFTARSPRCCLIAIFRAKDIIVLEMWWFCRSLRVVA
jgi:hypothetical protein